MFKYLFTLTFALSSIMVQASEPSPIDTMPTVFTVGEYGKDYEKLVSACDLALFNISGQSMDTTYKHWLKVMNDIEVFAESNRFDIKGVKVWINVFWNADGSIEHIVYFPKQSSRNINFDQFGKMLEDFVRYAPPFLVSSGCYSHFGSASFPTHADYILGSGG